MFAVRAFAWPAWGRWLRGVRAPLGIALLFWGAWALLPALLAASLPLDVVEGIAWGREWQWGYYKHPPLPAWVLYAAWRFLGRAGPFVLSQLCIAAALWCVWRLGRRLMDARRAALGTLLALGVWYYGWPTLEFNHNIAQMPLWAALALALHVALHDGRLRYWVVLGLCAGAALLTKYSSAIMLGVLLLCVLGTPHRRCLLGAGPWVALALMLGVFGPHVWWLSQHDWMPFAYAAERAHEAAAQSPRIKALVFVGTQFLAHVPLLLLLGATGMWRRAASAQPVAHGSVADLRYLLCIALGPVALVVAPALLLGAGLRDMWGVPMWNFSGLLLAAMLPRATVRARAARLYGAMALWLALLTAAMCLYLTQGAALRGRPSRMDWPAQALAQSARAQWAQLSSCPLRVVGGDYWMAGLAAEASAADTAAVWIAGDARYSPWITAQRLRAEGVLWVWEEGAAQAPEWLAGGAEGEMQAVAWGWGAQQEGLWALSWPRRPQAPALRVHWRAYVPLACAKK